MQLQSEHTFFVPKPTPAAPLTPEITLIQALLQGYGFTLKSTTPDTPLSLTALEKLAGRWGVTFQTHLLPLEALFELEDLTSPALLYTPSACALFWHRLGPLSQWLDPHLGRQWLTRAHIRQAWQAHPYPLTPAAWQEVAQSHRYYQLRQSWLMALEIEARQRDALMQQALEVEGWRGLATFDAAIRYTTHLVAQRALSHGEAAFTALQTLFKRALSTPTLIPADHWLITEIGADELQFRGVAFLVIEGCQLTSETSPYTSTQATPPQRLVEAVEHVASQPEPSQVAPWPTRLRQLLPQDNLWAIPFLGVAMGMAAFGLLLQVILFRGFMTLGETLTQLEVRASAIGLLFGFGATLLILEWFIDHVLSGLGRRLDVQLRQQILSHLPQVNQSHLQNIPTSDLMERIHIVRDLHNLPQLIAQLIRLAFQLFLTLLGLAFIAPLILPLAILKVAITAAILWQSQYILSPHHGQQRRYLGQLSRFYLDSMHGLIPIHVHQARRAIWREYETMLMRWMRQRLNLSEHEFWAVAAEQISSVFLLVGAVGLYVALGSSVTMLPLILFWGLQLNILGHQLVMTALRYLAEQSKKERFFDLLKVGNKEEEVGSNSVSDDVPTPLDPHGVAITWQGVSFQSGENLILRQLDLSIEPRSHVAVVGLSGAGKSTLVKLMAGWHKPTSGQIWVDGQLLQDEQLAALRQTTAWVDPTVQLWNRSLWENLQYSGENIPLDILVQQAHLRDSLERLPKGLQNELGEQGRLLSSGQGQRVRFGRALQRADARLVLFDEPFRGLDRVERYELLQQARQYWSQATFICVTHDVAHTLHFDRVLVVEHGQIVEQGLPSELAAQPQSRYHALLHAEEDFKAALTSEGAWRQMVLNEGQLTELGVMSDELKNTQNSELNTQHSALNTQNPKLITPNSSLITNLAWSADQLGQGLFILAQKSGFLSEKTVAPTEELQGFQNLAALGHHIETIATRLGLEAEPIKVTYGDLESFLAAAGPAILQTHNGQCLLLLGGNRWWLKLLAPDMSIKRLRTAAVAATLRQPLDAPLSADMMALVTPMKLADEEQTATYHAMLAAHLKTAEFSGMWLLRLTPAAPVMTQIRQAGLSRYLMLATWSEAINGLLYLASFVVFAFAISQPQSAGWLIAGLLMLISRAPLELLRFLGEILLSVNVEGLLRQRLFYGLIHLHPDKIQSYGTGQFLGWSLETERFTLIGRVVTLIYGYTTSLLITAIFLAFGAGGWLHGVMLLLWMVLSGLLTWQTYQSYLDQHQFYLKMSQDLLEDLEGHQTRLMQQDPARWHEREDAALARYLNLSRIDDRHRTRLAILVPYGWLVMGLVGIMAPFIYYSDAASLGLSFLGVMWAFQQFQLLAPNLLDALKALVAWQLLKPIEEPLKTLAESPVEPLKTPKLSQPQLGQPLLEAQRLTFHYPQRQQNVLHNLNLSLNYGDKVWLDGPPGSGKSTLANLLVGLRSFDSGLLLLQGLDHHSLPTTLWQAHITLVPQFQENHIFNTTLAFNLLMGRAWPPSPVDLAEAETVCHELGLGNLLAAMPRGLQEPIGDAGWQLSQGERGRLFLARAILQQARLIILDETLASLDPESLHTVLQCVQKRAPTLLVIAHP